MPSRLSPSVPLRVAVTGGIGSGKSHVCHRLEAAGYPVFYCDDVAKHIIRTSPQVHAGLTTLIGPDVYNADGQLEKAVLAAYICGPSGQAEAVNAIVHPIVAESFTGWAKQQTAPIVFMECALLFESGFDRLTEKSILVVADDSLREARVMERDHVSREKARAWMALQMPEEDKALRADYLLRNDGSTSVEQEISALLAELTALCR